MGKIKQYWFEIYVVILFTLLIFQTFAIFIPWDKIPSVTKSQYEVQTKRLQDCQADITRLAESVDDLAYEQKKLKIILYDMNEDLSAMREEIILLRRQNRGI